MTADDFDPVSYARIEAKLQAGRERAKAERIAAVAPELLAALRELVEQHERLLVESRITKRDREMMETIKYLHTERARAVIAAAEGRS